MQRIRAIVITGIMSVVAAGLLVAQEPSMSETDPVSRYAELVEILLAGEATADDFLELRNSYTGTAYYNPYGGNDPRETLSEARSEGGWEAVAERIEELLVAELPSLDLHLYGSIAYRELDDESVSRWHREVYLGLVRSIINGRDGTSPETSYHVITVREQYAVLRALGYRSMRRGRVQESGSEYDVHTIESDDDDAPERVYFNIDRPMAWLDKNF
ncbi:MAG: DUF4919 domain-containing protein [Spirochaetales bacterium]|nr:DUF4919 domain-containing protein [Spirochaetales bacterium]